MTFTRYISSAGSGKTYTLVKEYISIALGENDNFKKILAITFTNKAAAEMKERILSSLESLSRGNQPELKKEIVDNTGLTSIEKKSGAVLTRILHNYSHFSVMTIDSFFLKLLRAFSFEEDIPAGFEVELDMEKVSEAILKKVYEQIGKEPGLTEIILEFIFSKIRAQKSFNIERDLLKLESEIINEKWDKRAENLKKIEYSDLKPTLLKLKGLFIPFIEKVRNFGEKFLNMIEDEGLKTENFAYKESGIAGTFLKAAELSSGNLKKFKPGDRFISDKWIAKSAPDHVGNKIGYLLENGLQDLKNDLENCYNREYSKAVSALLVYENMYLLSLNVWISEFIDNYSSENRIIPISEFNRRIYSLIRDDEIPFVYSILGNKYSNILIDEFQDTSGMQWDCLFPLIENSLSVGEKCLVVGDSKQSIYRWRGGDLDILLKGIPEKINPEILKTVDLKKNFRSLSNIVKFNNELFRNLRSLFLLNPELHNIYKNSFQESTQEEGGYISVDFIERGEKNGESDKLFLRLVEIINSLIDEGFSYGDITILTRKNEESMKIAEYLLANDFPVISPDSLKLSRSPLYRFIINLLKLLFNPDERLLTAEILWFMYKFGENSLKIESPEIKKNEMDQIVLPKIISDFLSVKELYKRLPLYETVEGIIRRFDLANGTLFESGGLLLAFLDMVKNYSEENGEGLSGFFEWCDINGDKFLVPGSGEFNGISIMTIHKAKGLQFECVIIPFANWNYKGKEKMIWAVRNSGVDIDLPGGPPYYVKASKTLENSIFSNSWIEEERQEKIDNINLFYVACTRAISSLSILSEPPSSSDNVTNATLLHESIGRMEWMNTLIDGKRFEYGFLPDPREEKNEDSDAQSCVPFVSIPWSGRITIIRRTADMQVPKSDLMKKKIEIGNCVHEILAGITTKEGYHQVMEKILRSYELDSESVSEVRVLVEKVLSDPYCGEWFIEDLTVHNEREILFEGRSYRPDKMIIDRGNATVIDFKTGEKNDKDKKQVSEYIRLLEKSGYKDVRGILYYIEKGEVDEI